MSTIYFCKMCGRTGRFDEKPNFCYFDRVDHLENVSDEDAVKMGLNIPEGETFEFPGDVRWDPMTGDAMLSPSFGAFQDSLGKLLDGDLVSGRTLKDFQRDIMERVFK